MNLTPAEESSANSCCCSNITGTRVTLIRVEPWDQHSQFKQTTI